MSVVFSSAATAETVATWEASEHFSSGFAPFFLIMMGCIANHRHAVPYRQIIGEIKCPKQTQVSYTSMRDFQSSLLVLD
jgi:hypothetical protein